VWSWDISYLPTNVKGIWLYLYLVVDVWSRKIVAWDVEEKEDPEIAAKLLLRACFRDRISHRRLQPLILHAYNGHAMRAATLEARMEKFGILCSFSRPRVSNDNPCSESLLKLSNTALTIPAGHSPARMRPVFGLPHLSSGPTVKHRHSGIKFVTPHQRH
jgi:transposase InsO family protein